MVWGPGRRQEANVFWRLLFSPSSLEFFRGFLLRGWVWTRVLENLVVILYLLSFADCAFCFCFPALQFFPPGLFGAAQMNHLINNINSSLFVNPVSIKFTILLHPLPLFAKFSLALPSRPSLVASQSTSKDGHRCRCHGNKVTAQRIHPAWVISN